MIYFIVGPSGVGKTYFSKLVQEIYGLPIYDTGPILRKIHTESKTNKSFYEWVVQNEKIYGDNFAISIICENIKDKFNPNEPSIIIGNRCLEGINYIIDYFKLTNYCIIYLDASYKCLKSNYEKRENINLSDEIFKQKIDGGNKMGLTILKQFVLDNLNNNCYYYFKESNENLNYINIFKEISKLKNLTRKKKK